MNPNSSLRINERNALTDQIKKKHKETLSGADKKVIKNVVSKYILLKHSHKSYMEYCSVYKEIQESLIGKILTSKGNILEQLKNQIVRNAIVLVQFYKYIENGERYSYSDFRFGEKENLKMVHPHILGYTGFGFDDFLSCDTRKSTLMNDLRSVLKMKSSEVLIERYFSGLNTWQSETSDELNKLKRSVDGIEIDNSLSQVTLSGMQNLTQQTMILSPLIYLSDLGHTIPLDWSAKEWMYFGKQTTGLLRTTHLKNCGEQKKPINFDEGGIVESNLRAEIKSMMEDKLRVMKEEMRPIKPKTEAVTGRKNLRKITNTLKSQLNLTM